MHFNFHLDGNESPEKLRRIANAVLALGGAKLIPEDEVSIHLDATPEMMAFFNGKEAPAFPNADERNDSGSTAEWIGGVKSNPEEGREFSLDEAVAAVASANAVVSDPKRDVNGLPWDERIHSSSRAVNADGSWRAKRGVDPGLVAAVEDELRAVAVHEAVSAPIPPAPPAAASLPVPPAPPANGRSYADVVNVIMSKKLSPEVYVAVLGESLPDFAKTCKANPAVADEMYEKLSNI